MDRNGLKCTVEWDMAYLTLLFERPGNALGTKFNCPCVHDPEPMEYTALDEKPHTSLWLR